MLNWFKNKKKNTAKSVAQPSTVTMKRLDYPAKIILAWAKAIDGNVEISDWLTTNGFPELTIACAAIKLKDDARKWLMENGFPHLLAMINAAEGNKKAAKWLELNQFEMLFHISQAVEDEDDSWKWLQLNATPDLFILTQSIKKVKDQIEENHNDIHSFGKD